MRIFATSLTMETATFSPHHLEPSAPAAFHCLDTGGPYPADLGKIRNTKARRLLAPFDPNPWL